MHITIVKIVKRKKIVKIEFICPKKLTPLLLTVCNVTKSCKSKCLILHRPACKVFACIVQCLGDI